MSREVRDLHIRAPRIRRTLAWSTIALAFIGAIGALVWLDRTYFLTEAVNLWTVSDDVIPADAVAVLGGGVYSRPFAAAEYYKRGLAPEVLLANVRIQPVTAKILYSETEANRKVLVEEGVPENAIKLFGTDLSNTHQEAMALRAWALHNHAKTLIVPTDYFSSRRVKWTLRHVFAGTGIRTLVPALDSMEFPRDGWWHDEKGLIDFQNEILKYIYYRIKY